MDLPPGPGRQPPAPQPGSERAELDSLPLGDSAGKDGIVLPGLWFRQALRRGAGEFRRGRGAARPGGRILARGQAAVGTRRGARPGRPGPAGFRRAQHWQAREIKKGLPAFQVGPTCYRGLWIVDGAFLLEAATIVGPGSEARSGIAYEAHLPAARRPDQGDGQFLERERHRAVDVRAARPAHAGQGVAGVDLAGLGADRRPHCPLAARIARKQHAAGRRPGAARLSRRRTGRRQDPRIYQRVLEPDRAARGDRRGRVAGPRRGAGPLAEDYDDFYAAFRAAARRDLRNDSAGHAYLPTYMGADGGTISPQRAQWAFCHAVYPGKIFAASDPLVAGNLAMLKATEREGMVYGTGWDAAGLWNYFASFYAHAWLWQGDGRKAAEVLYAFANHASPLLCWREEQAQGERFRKVGDMPHNWASANSSA